MCKISVLMPVYNVELWVEDAIRSILMQTFQDFELVVVNDSSTDNTLNIVNSFKEKDFRIKVLNTTTNSGIVDSLNLGLKYCVGDYIVRMDGDDISVLNRLEVMYFKMSNNSSIDILGSQVISIDTNNIESDTYQYPENYNKIKKISRYINPILHIWMCKRSLYDELGGYRHIQGAEDYDFILRAISKGKKIINIPDKLYKVRRGRDGNTTLVKGLEKIISHKYCLQLFNERIKNKSFTDSYSMSYLYNMESDLKLERPKFEKSQKYFFNGYENIKSKRFIKGTWYILLSMLTSKYMFYYIYNRALARIISYL